MKDLAGKELLVELAMAFAFIAAVVASNGQPLVAGAALAVVIFLGKWLGDRANHVNPAITLGLLANGQVGTLRGLSLVAVQLVAGVLAVFAVTFIKTYARGPRR